MAQAENDYASKLHIDHELFQWMLTTVHYAFMMGGPLGGGPVGTHTRALWMWVTWSSSSSLWFDGRRGSGRRGSGREGGGPVGTHTRALWMWVTWSSSSSLWFGTKRNSEMYPSECISLSWSPSSAVQQAMTGDDRRWQAMTGDDRRWQAMTGGDARWRTVTTGFYLSIRTR